MSTNVIFLDFDGAMYSNRVILHHPDNASIPDHLYLYPFLYYWRMDEVAVGMLNKLFDLTYYELVISSTWSSLLSKDEIKLFLDANDIKAPMHEIWTTPKKLSSYRANEISWWLRENECKDYMIIDDESSGQFLRSFHEDGILRNLVMVDADHGMSLENFAQMKNIVETW